MVYLDERFAFLILIRVIIIIVQILLQLLVKIKLCPWRLFILKESSEETFQLFLYRRWRLLIISLLKW